MRILVFYQYFGTPKGKWSTRIYELTKRWVNEGNKVTVVTSPYEKSDIKAKKRIERQKVEGIELIVINYPDSNRFSKLKRILNFLLFSFFSIYYALTEKTDIVIASSGPITVGVPALFAKFFRRKKYIFEVRDLWPQGAISLGILTNPLLIKVSFFFEKLCYKQASCVVGCSQGMADNITDRFPNVYTSVIPNASDNSLFKTNVLSNKEGKPIFIYTGSLGAMDDVDLVIEATKVLKERGEADFLVEIVGDGVERNNLEQKVRLYQLSNVVFTGLLPKKEVVNKITHALAAFVCFKPLPILNTVSPNKMFDAFAASVPIIQNTDGWIKDYVNIHQCGISVDPKDPNSMADAMKKFLSDKSFQVKASINAKKAAETDFNRDRLSEKYMNIIENVIHG
ncbi:glycosyltransferase family 4 protein [Saccharicrinis aurantiacus]|uniref:glycosyltransferase family 4 protein n=1 Tax=Saccharicrinis aurantiacus TaxID=1849719 RepID=UPI000839565B|nr:glycosyltransferase family 4 protein [Saccharicrinis aurantiacus]